MTVEKNIVTDTIFDLYARQPDGAKYRMLAGALRQGISGGKLPPGTQLPPVRDLAWRLGMTPGTVARAYTLLTDEDQLSAEIGRGTFVAGQAEQRPPLYVTRPWAEGPDGAEMINLFTARLPDLGQVALINRAFQRLSERPDRALLEYPTAAAFVPARQAVVDWLSAVPLGVLNHEDVVLSHGAQSAISLVMQAVLRGRRPVVMVEELAYPGFRRAAELLRAEIVSVPMDAHGIVPAALEDLARKHEAQLLCTSPELNNPTAITTPLDRRREIAEVARRCAFDVLEDDCTFLGESRPETYRALQPEQGWFVSSISKTLTPALRIGFAIAPQGKRQMLRRVAENGFFGLAKPLADLTQDLLTRDETREIVRAVCRQNAVYVRAVVNALGDYDLSWNEHSPFAWLRLPPGWRSAAFCLAAEAQGVQVRPAEDFAPRNGFAPHAVRIGMNAQIALPDFEAALARLRRLLDNPPEQSMMA
ncbi:PLP-dependent aminotransferase family protein [Salipiger sp. 1_MG-2023]|uniref:aminotransferase-like domain-containing protein n=1 Tax=Salipiger sp. 1_MG-2023 TaxID=3062665 RepID=UPI0026E1F795|nr:PLP-dependent aminotransferase family protein [Salipiger sp. 1_MG-2023]MDO6585923.1 PLP-dependent aminotransferase family protein [Salipiger sp. 1_MG-2023]